MALPDTDLRSRRRARRHRAPAVSAVHRPFQRQPLIDDPKRAGGAPHHQDFRERSAIDLAAGGAVKSLTRCQSFLRAMKMTDSADVLSRGESNNIVVNRS